MTAENRKNKVVHMMVASLWWLTCALLTADSGFFLYPSLSQTLLGEACALVMCAVIMVCGIMNGGKWPANIGVVLVFSWGVYIALHSLFIESAEHYRMYYMVASLLLLLSLTFALHNDYLTIRGVENGLLLMVVLQISCMVLQLVGIRETGNPFFKCTGFGPNPNSACVLFAALMPVMMKRMSSSNCQYAWLLVLLVSILFVLSLGCRTAFIGIIVMAFVRMLCGVKIQDWLRINSLRKYICTIVICLCAAMVLIFLYRYKKDSADGRLLVWKVSAAMIVKKPCGWGVGMFERCYNLCQGEYFEKYYGTESERNLAGYVRMAYNDYLEHGVETGFVGALFLSLFYVLTIMSFLQKRDKIGLSVASAFSVMSMVNFICSAIQPWHVLVAYGAFAFQGRKRSACNVASLILSVVIVLLCCVMLSKYYNLISSQVEMCRLKMHSDANVKDHVGEVEKLENRIDTSGEYYMFLAEEYERDSDYKNAIASLEKAARYTSDPRLFFEMFNCYDKLGDASNGIDYVLTISNMIPQNMTSRNVLLRWYDSQGEYDKAVKVATDMVETKLKIRNAVSLRYQEGTRYYINHINRK